MSLIDKDKTVEAVAMYLFINDAIKSTEPMNVADYRTFAELILTDVPETDIVRCRDCKRQRSCITFEGLGNYNGFCSMGERKATKITTDCSWK